MPDLIQKETPADGAVGGGTGRGVLSGGHNSETSANSLSEEHQVSNFARLTACFDDEPDYTRLHLEMIHKLAADVEGKLVVATFGEDPDGEKLRAMNMHAAVGAIGTTEAHIHAVKDERHRNVYMPLVVMRPDLEPGRKGGLADVVAVLAVVADFDDAEASKWAERCPLPPDYVLETSAGRFQAFYLLDRPATVEEAKPIAARLEAYAGVDTCSKDMSHVWRVPGCLNWPNRKKVHTDGRDRSPQLVKVAKEWDGSRTRLEDLDAAVPPLSAPEPVALAPKSQAMASAYFHAESFLMGLPKALQNKIMAPAVMGQRSEDFFDVVQALIKRNLTDDQIEEVLQINSRGSWTKYEGRVVGEIARVRGKPPTAPDLLCGANGAPLANHANALTLLQRKAWAGVLRWNEFTSAIEIHRAPPYNPDLDVSKPVPWSDADDVRAAEWMQRQGLNIKPHTVAEVVPVVAHRNAYHPVKDYLDGLTWDGVPRLDTWLVDYLDAPDNKYVRAVGSKWAVSAVARIYRPGCKVDTALIIEGLQGARKSFAFRALGGEWFSDQMGEIGTKDTLMQMQGAWIIEIAELDAMSKSEVNAIKRFLTAQVDRFRPPYGRRVTDFPRQSVFAGSTNESEYLRDPTGGRRFWPVPALRADPEGLAEARDQLWAEAVHRFRQGEQWWLTDAEEALASAEQKARQVSDPWEEKVLEYAVMHEAVTTALVLRVALAMHEPREWGDKRHSMRVAAILRSNGWMLDTSKRPRRYVRPEHMERLAGVGKENA